MSLSKMSVRCDDFNYVVHYVRGVLNAVRNVMDIKFYFVIRIEKEALEK